MQVVNKFKKLVEKEASILNQLVNKWNELLTDTTIPEDSSFKLTLSFSTYRFNFKENNILNAVKVKISLKN